MATLEEQRQNSSVPIDNWSIREQLCLALVVARIGDQNWMSVSRALRPFAEPNRPPDWFSQNNCAAQYISLLESVRLERVSVYGSNTVTETPLETILKKLVKERKMELRKKMDEKYQEYLMKTEEKSIVHTQWLKQRKLEIERKFRSVTKVTEVVTGQKRTASNSVDTESSQESEPAPVASVPPLVSLAKPDTTVFAPTVQDPKVTKQDKRRKAKRVYSGRRKIIEETSSEEDSRDSYKKSNIRKRKLKRNKELPKSRRRLSASTKPNDSISKSSSFSTAILDDDQDYCRWKKSVMLVFNRLVTHKYSYLFKKPITDEQAPRYHSIVHRPMDLQTIQENIENGVIRTTQEFHRDVLLMFLNSLMYNKRNETVYKMTRQMMTDSLQEMEILTTAQEQNEVPVRREPQASTSGLKRKRQDDILTS